MDWIKGVQKGVPWLASLARTPKIMVSALIIGAGGFIVILGWMPSPQTAIPWLTSLPLIPKMIVSVLIFGVCGFILLLVWTPPPETVIATILTKCYRRALFTRTQTQLNFDAMFNSIAECRKNLQQHIPEIRSKELRTIAVELLATLELIERRNPIHDSDDIKGINLLKLSALHAFRQLAAAIGRSYPLPDGGKLAEAAYFTREEADAPPSLAVC